MRLNVIWTVVECWTRVWSEVVVVLIIVMVGQDGNGNVGSCFLEAISFRVLSGGTDDDDFPLWLAVSRPLNDTG
jgi:hypothetical protein